MQGGREVIQFLQCSAWIISTLKKLAVKERKERDCHVKKKCSRIDRTIYLN